MLAFPVLPKQDVWDFEETVPWSRLLAQCYGANREAHWSLLAFMDSVHSETVQGKKGAKGSMH